MKFKDLDKIPGAGKSFLTLGEGKSVTGVFRGETEIVYKVYENGKYRVVPSTDPNGKFSFVVNFIIIENGQLVSKIFQGNYHDYKALAELNEQFDVEACYVKISQTGERQTKRISFMPIVKEKPNQAKLAQVPLQNIKPKIDVSTTFDGPMSDPEEFDSIGENDIPF